MLGETIVDGDAEPRQRQAGILANAHPRRAGVILLALKSDPVLPDADDGGDDADLETAAFERLALLDMRLEISDMPPAFGRGARPAGKARRRAARRRMVRPLLRSRAASISASVTPPT